MTGIEMGILSIIEESWPKKLRIGNLCVVFSTKVNVAKIFSALFKDF